MAERFPRIVKVQLVVAAVAVVVTIAAALEIPQLLKTKKQLQSEIQFLEERKSEAETSLNALVDKLNKQQTTLIKGSIRPRASATEVAGVYGDRQIYDFRLWLDASANLKQQIDKVSYTFDHPPFRNKVQESTDPSNEFEVRYRGWGCLYVVTIDVLLKDGRSEEIYFEMCGVLKERPASSPW